MKDFKENIAKEKFEYEQRIFNQKLLEKLSKRTYCGNEFDDLDVTSNTPEKAFSSVKYYNAMKEVPVSQKKALYLLVVCEYSILQVAKMLHKKPSEVLALSSMAINNFKKNLRKGV